MLDKNFHLNVTHRAISNEIQIGPYVLFSKSFQKVEYLDLTLSILPTSQGYILLYTRE